MHETGLCIKCEKRLWITNDDVVTCVKSQNIDWIPLRLAIWNMIIYRMKLQQNRTCLNATYFSYNHSITNKSANLPKRRATAGQRTVGLLPVSNDAHNPINNPTVWIADPRKQIILLSRNDTTDRRTILLNDGDVCSSPWHTILATYFSWDYVRSNVLSDLSDIPRLISLHHVPTPLKLPTWKLSLRHTT